MEKLHALQVTFLGATNTKGSRVKIKSERFNKSKIISYNYEFNNIYDIAKDYLEKNGFEIIGLSEFKNSYILTSTTFKTL